MTAFEFSLFVWTVAIMWPILAIAQAMGWL